MKSRYSDESAGLSLLVGVNGKNKDYPQVLFVYKEKVKTPASLGKMKKTTNLVISI